MSNYWHNKNVLITGINGFIGGNLAKAMLNVGANVFGLIRNQSKDTFLFFEKLDEKVTLIEGDLVDKDLLSRIIAEEQINSVFHLAAQVEVGVGLDNPYLTFETNIRGTYSLLEAIRQNSRTIESVVIASTDKSYGSYPKDKMPYKEDYPLLPKYPYDTSKACADMISQVYATEVYKLPVVVTRFCNIYGPGQLNFSAIFPDAIRSALGYTKFIPRGNGSQIRDFIFSEDVVDLYLKIGELLSKEPEKLRGEIFNAGTNTATSVKEVIETIYDQVGNNSEKDRIILDMSGKKTTGEIDCQFMDFVKVNEYVGWKPKHTFEEGVLKTINWFKSYLVTKYE